MESSGNLWNLPSGNDCYSNCELEHCHIAIEFLDLPFSKWCFFFHIFLHVYQRVWAPIFGHIRELESGCYLKVTDVVVNDPEMSPDIINHI